MKLILCFLLPLGSTLRFNQMISQDNIYLDSCLSEGKWNFDAEPYTYPIPAHGCWPLDPKAKSMYYKWSPGCRPLESLNKDTFCKAMEKHEYKRVLHIGDSLQSHLFFSFHQLIEKGNYECKTRKGQFDVQCPQGKVSVEMVGSENLKASSWGDWEKIYSAIPDATLVYYNTGSHQHTFAEFKDAFDVFLEKATKLVETRPKDMFLFRTTNKGHSNCDQANRPLTLEEFKSQKNVTGTYEYWNLFPTYNAYAREKFAALRADLQPHFPILDTRVMNAMRPDGHGAYVTMKVPQVEFPKTMSAAEEEEEKGLDCLHYRMPGVPDWTNHLLVNRLMELPALS